MAQVLLTVEREVDTFISLVSKPSTSVFSEFSFNINPVRTAGSFLAPQYWPAFDDPYVFVRSGIIGSGGMFVKGSSDQGLLPLQKEFGAQALFTEAPTNLLGQSAEASLLVAAPRPPTFDVTPPTGPTGPTGPTAPSSNFYWGN